MEFTPATLTGLPPIYTHEWGFLWENLFNYIVLLLFTGGAINKGVKTFFAFLKAQVNRIQFDLPLPGERSIRIDFSEMAWDDAFFDYVERWCLMKVDARESQATQIKLKHQKCLKGAPDEAAREKVMEQYQEELEALTDSAVDDIKKFDPQLFAATVTRFGAEYAEEYIRVHLKASVAKRKNGSATRVSMTETVKQLNGTLPNGKETDSA